MNMELVVIPAAQLDGALGGAGIPGWLGAISADVKADVNKLVDSIGGGAQRLIGCGFGANSRQEFGRCILTGKLDGQK